MRELSVKKRVPIWLLIVALPFSMVLPLILMLIDEESGCHLIPLITKNQNIPPEYLASIYFAIPLIVGLYGIYLVFKNRDLRRTESGKFYLLCGLTLLDLSSPILLMLWGYVALIIWIGSGCYTLKLRMF